MPPDEEEEVGTFLAKQIAKKKEERSANSEMREGTFETLKEMIKPYNKVVILEQLNPTTHKSVLTITGLGVDRRIGLTPSNEFPNTLVVTYDSHREGMVTANWNLSSLATNIAESILDAMGQ